MSSIGLDVPELEQELNIEIPPPLDPHIASVSLRTGSNNPGDYFDLLLSASFGSEHVTLESGPDTIEVKIAIRKAEIKLDGANCSFHLLTDGEVGGDGWRGQDKYSEDAQRAGSRAVSLGLDASDGAAGVSAAGGIEYSSRKSNQTSRTIDRSLLPWRLISNDTVQVGYLENFSRALHGRILDENVSIRATPTSKSGRVGVLARIRVREQWIDIEEIKAISVSNRVKGFLEGLVSGDTEIEARRQLFSKLLVHLIAVQLQDRSDRKNATLAAAAMVFSPASGAMRGVNLPRPRPAIQIDPTAIERFIQTAVGSEAPLLAEMGVELDSDTGDAALIASVADVLASSGNRRYYYLSSEVVKETVLECLSGSFGLVVRELGVTITQTPMGDYYKEGLVEVTSNQCPTISASEVITKLGGNKKWWVSAVALSSGILTKGDEAFQIARLFGFDKSYQTLRKRMSKYSVSSGYGGLITFADLFRAIDMPDAIRRISGLQMSVPPLGEFTIQHAERDEAVDSARMS